MVIESNAIFPLPLAGEGQGEGINLTLLINTPPYSHQGATTAYQFTKAALAKGHRIAQIFFYQDGAYNGNQLITPPQDELNLISAWQQLAREQNIELIICIAAALRRGVLDNPEAERHAQQHPGNLASGFKLGGLGQLIEAVIRADRFISFG